MFIYTIFGFKTVSLFLQKPRDEKKMRYKLLLLILTTILTTALFSQSKKSIVTCDSIVTIVCDGDSVRGFFEFHSIYNKQYKSFERNMMFYFSGIKKGSDAYDVSWKNDEDSLIKGKLNVKSDKIELQFDDYPLGYDCCNIYDSGYESQCIDKSKSLIDIREIKNKKQFIYKTPSDTAKTKMYLQKGDVVKIYKEIGDWQYFFYFNYYLNKTIKGYLKKRNETH